MDKILNYSQSTDRLNDFIRWSRESEVRKRRLSKWKRTRRLGITVNEAVNSLKRFEEAVKKLRF